MADVIPANYDWKVALKKLLFGILNVVVAGSVYNKVEGPLAPGASVAAAGTLTLIFDFLKLKYPSQKWL